MKKTTDTTSKIRSRILASAITIIRESGIQKLTIRGICEKANCTTGAFYHYFPGKDDLIATIISDSRDDMSLYEKQEQLRDKPVEFLMDFMVDVAKTLSSFGLSFIEEFLSPKNRSLNINYLSRSKSGNTIVNDLVVALTNASMSGMFVEQEAFGFEFIDQIYRELNSIFYGCVFDWALAGGSYDLNTHLRKMLTLHLNHYLKPEFQL